MIGTLNTIMQPEKKTRPVRSKKKIPEMFPVKKWLSLQEAASYMDMSENHFQNLRSKSGLTISIIGKKKYYRVSELDQLIEDNILIRKITPH